MTFRPALAFGLAPARVHPLRDGMYFQTPATPQKKTGGRPS